MSPAVKKTIIYNHQGIILARVGHNRAALKCFNAAIKAYPRLPLSTTSHDMRYRLYSNRGLTREHLRDFQGALTDYDRTLNLNPKYAIGYCNRGGIKYNLKRYQAAVTDFKKAIYYQHHYPKAWFFLGMAETRAKQGSAALQTFSSLIKMIPKSFVPWFERGCLWLSFNQYAKAVTDFYRALKLNSITSPSRVAILNNLGMTENNLHHYQRAKKHLQAALKMAPNNRYALANLKTTNQGLDH